MASSSSSSNSNSPCAACKFLRRKCQPECVFAPYFPPDQPQKFANVHKVFGASNVTKLLNELLPSQREDAVNSLAYEADMRLRDPVYGCVGVISLLQHQLRQLQMDLSCAKSELSNVISKRVSLIGFIPVIRNLQEFVCLYPFNMSMRHTISVTETTPIVALCKVNSQHTIYLYRVC
ncbi:Lateral organ boundaries domain containing protein [Parasponia andersonii]|uniref:Lateral organ boundaries domain containing protein n=2 Tax=Cannabaceae TaxID=3481 RepID=A0A2P5AP66_PARAD|nr:Lateral organ boundaries domain containing protein [Parasponia andersonii]